MTELPPIGQIQPEQAQEVRAYIDALDKESNDSRAPWAALADQNVTVFELGSDNATDIVYANDIQDAVVAVADLQSKEPPVSELEPSDTGGKPLYFWIGEPEEAMMAGLPPIYYSPTEQVEIDPATNAPILTTYPPQPIPTLYAKQLEASGIDEDVLLKVDTETTGEFYQMLFDKTWERSRLTQWYRNNTIDNNIAGWKVDLYECDRQDRKVYMTELSVHQAFLDPTQRTLERMAYAGVDILVDQGWACRRYPDIEDLIKEQSRDGQPVQSSSGINSLAGLDGIDFARKMVVMRLRWLRNQPIAEQPVPMTEKEALDAGIIISPPPAQPVDGDPFGDAGVVQDESTTDSAGIDDQDAPLAPTDGMEQGGEVPVENQSAPVAQFLLAGTEEPTAPNAVNWPHHQPMRYALRRLTYIGDALASDVEESSWDIPLVHNVCIPIPRKPWGIGEPYRQLEKQKARNRQIGAIVDHCDYNAHPARKFTESMYAATQSVQKDMNRPGAVVIIPDTLAGQDNDLYEPLPPLAPHLPETQQMLKGEIMDSAGNADVMRGKTEPGVDSGKAIALLQNAGSSAASLKSMFSGDMVYRLDQLILHDLVRFTTVEDVERITKKYPPHVIQEFLKRGADIEWGFNVSIAGGGALMQQKRIQAQEDLQTGAISMETYRDVTNRDHKQEEQRFKRATEKAAQMAAIMPQPEESNGKRNPSTRDSRNAVA